MRPARARLVLVLLPCLLAAACGGPPALALPDGAGVDGPAADAADAAPDAPDASGGSALCGPPQSPCRVLRDEPVSDDLLVRNFVPALTLDSAGAPHVLYTVAENGFHGFHAWRGEAGWSVEPLPGAVATGALAQTSDALVLLTYDGDATSTLWSRDPSGWRPVETLAATEAGLPQGLLAGTDGTLHAIFGQGRRFAYARRGAAGWTTESLGHPDATEFYGLPALALAGGHPHTFFWGGQTTPGPDWQLYWAVPGVVAEPVLALGFPIIGWSEVGLAVAPDGDLGTPHLLAERMLGTDASEIVYARRVGAGVWDLRPVAQGNIHPWYGWSCPPPVPGAACSFDFVTYKPLAVAARTGEVRLLYVRYHGWGSPTVDCTKECVWRLADPHLEGRLEIAWPEGSTVGRASVLEGITPEGGTVAVDAAGTLHLAVYDGGFESWDLDTFDLSRVRYLAIGSR